jgi:hypothetical protein
MLTKPARSRWKKYSNSSALNEGSWSDQPQKQVAQKHVIMLKGRNEDRPMTASTDNARFNFVSPDDSWVRHFPGLA